MKPSVLIWRGVLGLVLGLILVAWPGATLSTILILFPVFAIIDGTCALIIGANTAKEGRWYSFIPMGILEILIGIFVLIWPGITITAFVFLMALWAFVLGLGEFFIAIVDTALKATTRWLYAIAGIITFVLGVLVMIYPIATSVAVIWLFGVYFVIYGILVGSTGIWLSSKVKEKTK